MDWWVGLMENSNKVDDVGGVRCPVLRRRPPFRPAGFRGNDDTREKAAGKTRKVQLQ
jgi:hypothetical protein